LLEELNFLVSVLVPVDVKGRDSGHVGFYHVLHIPSLAMEMEADWGGHVTQAQFVTRTD
jgi:hypothetical protein